jgi:hypothetical protein
LRVQALALQASLGPDLPKADRRRGRAALVLRDSRPSGLEPL